LPPPPDYTVTGQGWIGGPLLERVEAAPSGFFVNAESSVVWTHFFNQLVGGQVTLTQTSGAPLSSAVGLPPGAGLPITGSVVTIPGNSFNATVTPRLELGYRLPDGMGEVKLSYRNLDASASDSTVVPILGPAAQNQRLDIQFVDLDYGTREFSLGPDWEMRFAVGMRYAEAYFDSQVAFANPMPIQEPYGTAPFTRLTQSESLCNWYLGAHGVFEVGRKVLVPQLTFFGRVEGCGMFGHVKQSFKESFLEAPGITQISVSNDVGCPLLASQLGLSWDIPNWNHSRLMIGYQIEAWWEFGRGDNDQSLGTLEDQGVFLRAEFNF
jgi:hypothetical protein